MRNIKLSESTLAAGTFFDIDGPAEFQNVDFDSNAPTVLKTTTNAEHNISFENCTFTSDTTRGIVDVRGPNLGDALAEKRADFINCRFESCTLESGNAFVTNSFFLYSNIIHERTSQLSLTGFKFLNNTLQSIDGRLSTIEIKGTPVGATAIVQGLYIKNNNWIDRVNDVTADYNAIFATNLASVSHKADVYDNFSSFSGRCRIPTTRPVGSREVVGASSPFTITLTTSSTTGTSVGDETFLANGTAPFFGSVSGAGYFQGSPTGLLNMSFEGAFSNGAATFPDVTCSYDSSLSGNDIVINYQFINSTNEERAVF